MIDSRVIDSDIRTASSFYIYIHTYILYIEREYIPKYHIKHTKKILNTITYFDITIRPNASVVE